MQDRNALFRELTGLGLYENIVDSEVKIDPTDERIDVDAKYSLMRMLKGDTVSKQTATGLINAINTGELGGIYGDSMIASVKYAKGHNTNWWLMISDGEDGCLVLDPKNPLKGIPIIIFRSQQKVPPLDGIRKIPARLDAAIKKIWQTFKRFRNGELALYDKNIANNKYYTVNATSNNLNTVASSSGNNVITTTFPRTAITKKKTPIKTNKIIIDVRSRFIKEAINSCNIKLVKEDDSSITFNSITNSSGKASINILNAPDGKYNLIFTPPFTTINPVGPNIQAKADQKRIYRIVEEKVNLKQNRLLPASTKSQNGTLRIQNNNVNADIQPVWMSAPPENRSSRNGTSVDHCVIHKTGSSTQSAINTFLNPVNKTSAHYLIDEDGQAIKLVNENEAANHAGESHWGGRNGVNSFSIGIEIAHIIGGYSEKQITGLQSLLDRINASFPTIASANFIGHSDIAIGIKKNIRQLGIRRNDDPGPLFPWNTLSKNKFGRSSRIGPPSPFMYNGLFAAFLDIKLKLGDKDSTNTYGGKRRQSNFTTVIKELQKDLITIGYFCGENNQGNGVYDVATQQAVKMFQLHFMNLSTKTKRAGILDALTANAIKNTI